MVNKVNQNTNKKIKSPSIQTAFLLLVVLGTMGWWAGGDKFIKRLYDSIKPCPANGIIEAKIKKDHKKHSVDMVTTLQAVHKDEYIGQYLAANNKLFDNNGLIKKGFELMKLIVQGDSQDKNVEFATLVLEIDRAHNDALQAISSYQLAYGRFPHQESWQLHQAKYENFYDLKEEYFRRKNQSLPAGKQKIAPLEVVSINDPMIPLQSSAKESQLIQKFVNDVNKVHYDCGASIVEIVMALIAEKEGSNDADPTNISEGILKNDFVKGLGKFLRDDSNDCDDFAMALSQGLASFGEKAIIIDFDSYHTGGSGHWVNAMRLEDYPYAIEDEAIVFSFDNEQRVILEPQRLVKKVVYVDGDGTLLNSLNKHNLFTKQRFKELYLSPFIAIIDEKGRHEIDLCHCLGELGEK